ncbi:MAG TPA: hypothetical protein VGV09_18770 [Steroidobacteraceae bacterium]|nr:hypothetical protein [Steroidobacteraceae bacterium]
MGPTRLRSVAARSSDPHPDPFAERELQARVTRQLLGARFHFESTSPALLHLVHWAFGDLPEHKLSRTPAQLTMRLVLNESATAPRRRSGPPELTLMGGAGLLGAVAGPSSFVALSPDQGGALVTVASQMLDYPYHARYELIEFAVYTLATRALKLIPLHAACVSLNNRGLLLMGESGAGKSTLSLQCLLQKLEFVSEDAVFVSAQDLKATGVANFLHVCPDTLHWLPKETALRLRASPRIQRRSGVRKLEIDLRSGEYRLAARPPQLAAAVFLSPRAGGRTLLRRLSGKELSARLLAAQPYAASQPQWRQFAANLGAVGGYELRRGRHPQEGAERLRELLQGGK